MKASLSKIKGACFPWFHVLINHLLIVIIIVYNPFPLGQNLLLFKICFEKNSSFHQDGRFDRQRDAHPKWWSWFPFWSHSDLFGDQESGKCYISLHMSKEAKLSKNSKSYPRCLFVALCEEDFKFFMPFYAIFRTKMFFVNWGPNSFKNSRAAGPTIRTNTQLKKWI